MKANTRSLNCLYYPFSRCLDANVLKQLILIFDSIAFVDEAGTEEQRRHLMRQMARFDDNLFSKYDELQDDYYYLHEENAVEVFDPKEIPVSKSRQVAISTRADIEDNKLLELASQPCKYGLPYRPFSKYDESLPDRPTWQIFKGKITQPLIDLLYSDSLLESHLLIPGDDYRHWTLTYEAGSVIAVNFYLEAADSLQLVPVTTSELHHNIVIHKLKRAYSSQNPADILDSSERKRLRASLGYGEIIKLFSELASPAALQKCSFNDIIKFRRETEELRRTCVDEIDSTLRVIASDPSKAEYDAEVVKSIRELKRRLEDSEKKMQNIRDKILPSSAKALMYGTAGAGTVGAMATFLAGLSPGGVVAASALTVTAALFKEALGIWTELRKERRGRSNAITYLAKLSALGT